MSENLGTILSPYHRNSNPQTMCSCKPEELGDSCRVPVGSVGGRMVRRELAVRSGYHLTYSLSSDTVMLQQTWLINRFSLQGWAGKWISFLVLFPFRGQNKGFELLQRHPGVNLMEHAFSDAIHPLTNSGRICYGLALGYNMTSTMTWRVSGRD